jgi:hypothetical protein
MLACKRSEPPVMVAINKVCRDLAGAVFMAVKV